MNGLAHFTLDSDLSVPSNTHQLSIQGPDARFTLIIENADPETVRAEGALAAYLTFDAPSLEDAKEVGEDTLALALNALTFVTRRMFRRHALKRVVDWTPGLSKRRAYYFDVADVWEMAEPSLGADFAESVERLLPYQASEEAQAALRWYRLGVHAEAPEEQYAYFWYALEIAAEADKGDEKINSLCPNAGSHFIARLVKGTRSTGSSRLMPSGA